MMFGFRIGSSMETSRANERLPLSSKNMKANTQISLGRGSRALDFIELARSRLEAGVPRPDGHPAPRPLDFYHNMGVEARNNSASFCNMRRADGSVVGNLRDLHERFRL